MARLGGYSGEIPQGEAASFKFLQLCPQKLPFAPALCRNTLAQGTLRPVGGTPKARQNKRTPRASLGQGWPNMLRLA